eukprot:13354561-Alexandrium_andersonii.AAC.1
MSARALARVGALGHAPVCCACECAPPSGNGGLTLGTSLLTAAAGGSTFSDLLPGPHRTQRGTPNAGAPMAPGAN